MSVRLPPRRRIYWPRWLCSPWYLSSRKGLYPIASFPQALGTEAAGEIVGLPTDNAVLNDEEYKLRGFALGAKVAIAGILCTL